MKAWYLFKSVYSLAERRELFIFVGVYFLLSEVTDAVTIVEKHLFWDDACKI